jgi:GNAT superfamily N-acetyltransferase
MPAASAHTQYAVPIPRPLRAAGAARLDATAGAHGDGVQAVLRDGTPVRIRAIRPDDKQRLRSAFERLSPETVYHRFFQALKTLTAADLRRLTELDFRDHVALVLTTDDTRDEKLVGVARFARVAPSANRAEIAIVVVDAYQRRGAGALLLEHLVAAARAVGVRELLALVLEDNQRMLELLRSSGLMLRQKLERGVRHVVVSL